MRALAVLATAVLLAGCSSGQPAGQPPGTVPASPLGERIAAVLDGVALQLEVADDEAERATGLMGRTSVPAGTGMVFLYDRPVTFRFYMFRVPVPLRAVFLRDGAVVGAVLMPPCVEPEPSDCPTYGVDAPYDTVVETAPDTLPDVQPGDRYVPRP